MENKLSVGAADIQKTNKTKRSAPKAVQLNEGVLILKKKKRAAWHSLAEVINFVN